jgi:hypothetical protein
MVQSDNNSISNPSSFTANQQHQVVLPPTVLGLDLRAVDLMSDNQMTPYRLPFLAFPQIMRQVRNPILPDPPIDYSDNDRQMEVIAHHYLNEFNEGHIREVMEDYNQDSVIYEVLDEVPKTYYGKRGVRKMCKDVLGKVKNIELEHVSVNRNHAQVVWRGETTTQDDGDGGDDLHHHHHHHTIVGTDSFTFDENNHITSQTIVALTQQED